MLFRSGVAQRTGIVVGGTFFEEHHRPTTAKQLVGGAQADDTAADDDDGRAHSARMPQAKGSSEQKTKVVSAWT